MGGAFILKWVGHVQLRWVVTMNIDVLAVLVLPHSTYNWKFSWAVMANCFLGDILPKILVFRGVPFPVIA